MSHFCLDLIHSAWVRCSDGPEGAEIPATGMSLEAGSLAGIWARCYEEQLSTQQSGTW